MRRGGGAARFASSSLVPHLVEAQKVLDGRGGVEHQALRRDHDHEPVQRLWGKYNLQMWVR